ncbi:hypothetical protein AB0K00_53300 [Dactylosporangium sp. NPDC049525]|uniref:hypothetical protein n=1 Tax=Dactylosporangium sp. NPDC049525 TaxID=3154730 RepID=UPI0034416545
MQRGWRDVATVEHEARLSITNCSSALPDVALEPWGEDYWLKPDEMITVIAVGADGPLVWPGNTTTHAPFDVHYYPDAIAVYCNGAGAWVADSDGNRLECGHQRPDPSPPPPKPGPAVYRLTGPGDNLDSQDTAIG